MKRPIQKALAASMIYGMAAMATGCSSPEPPAQDEQTDQRSPVDEETEMATLSVGDIAPDFTLRAHTQDEISLSDFRGKKNVLVAFYILAFTGG